MSEKLVDLRNVRFVLYEMLHCDDLAQHDLYADHSRETFDMVLDTAYQLAQELLFPHYQSDDAIGATFDGTAAHVPPGARAVWNAFRDGGWFAPMAPYDMGGQQLPHAVGASLAFLFNAANTSAYMYVGAATGAALLIENHGTDEQKAFYLPRLFSGQWGGTMCLSEPDVGSSLGDLTTTAVKSPDGDYYLIKGVKRWISSGDHDLAENIVHPVLARIEGAPAGTKGISLFLVPKYRIHPDGASGEPNGVAVAGLEHKLGLRGQATATLNFGENGDCRGWLLGQANRGLNHMFDLVNNARIHTGMQAVAQASAAYHVALKYARERLQGRPFGSAPETPPQPLVSHADVRNMLLQQKAYVEGVYALLAYCAHLGDRARTAGGPEERERLLGMLGVLTPVCKAYGSDISFESIRLAIQCLGGAGFTEDFPIAQMLRDNKVFSIYEGANGIQAQDLLGRRIVKNNGADFAAVMGEIAAVVNDARTLPALAPLAENVAAAQAEVIAVARHLGAIGLTGDVPLYLANATLFLRCFSELVVSWMHLRQAAAAQRALDADSGEEPFYRGKAAAARWYIANILPHTLANLAIIARDERTALDCEDAWFDGADEAARV